MEEERVDQPKDTPPSMSSDAKAPSWLELMRIAPPFLWFLLAVVAFCLLYPTAIDVLKSSVVEKVSLGVVKIELAHIARSKEDSPSGAAVQTLVIDPRIQEELEKRFKAMSLKTQGATVLWVDDNHPYQNVAERRVLRAAGMSVDLAQSTLEAWRWLVRANYDLVITDLNRSGIGDPSEPCHASNREVTKKYAGCALLNKVGQCVNYQQSDSEGDSECVFMRNRPGSKPPKMIVYTSDTSLGTPAYATGITNQPSELFRLVLEGLEGRKTEP